MKIEIDRYEPARRVEQVERGRATVLRFTTHQGFHSHATVSESQDRDGRWQIYVSLHQGQLTPEEFAEVTRTLREEVERWVR